MTGPTTGSTSAPRPRPACRVAAVCLAAGLVPAGAAQPGEPPAAAATPQYAAVASSTPRCAPPPSDDLAAGPAGDRLQLDAVRGLATGVGQVIAVIDTGVAPHPRLAGRLTGGGDLVAGDGELVAGGLDDCDGHGTLVAGLLAAAPSPDDEVAGIAPDARILAIRQSSPAERAGDTRTLALAIGHAVALGATVVNISEAACVPAELAERVDGGLREALRAAAEADVLVVAAAGNIGAATDGGCLGSGSGQVTLPARHEYLLAVGAVGPDDAPAPFTVPGPWVDLAAPGTGLRSLAVDGGLTGAGVDGTSFAAPWVSGLAALVRERFPGLTAGQVGDRLRATARRPAGVGDEYVGYGVVDPTAALTAVPAVLVPPERAPAAARAALPGTDPVAAVPGAPGWVLLAAPVLLAATAVAATARLRRPR